MNKIEEIITAVEEHKLKCFGHVTRGSRYKLLRAIVEGKLNVIEVLEEESILA